MADKKAREEVGVVQNCPGCGRVVWTGTLCHHGAVPPPRPNEERKPDPHKKGKR